MSECNWSATFNLMFEYQNDVATAGLWTSPEVAMMPIGGRHERN